RWTHRRVGMPGPRHRSAMMRATGGRRPLAALIALLLCALPGVTRGDDPPAPVPANQLVRTANSPLSDILQFRLQDTYLPELHRIDGSSNTLTLAITAPLPKYRLIPFPQLSLVSVPTVTSVPGDATGLGDLRFVDIAVVDPGRHVLLG